MDLGLPPPPGAASGRTRSARERTITMVVVIAVMSLILCACLGFIGFYGWVMGQGLSESTKMISPWFDALKKGDYKTAAELTGPGVTPDQLREAVERQVGAPLVSYEMVPGSIRMRVDMAEGSEATCATYKFVGTRTKANVQMEIHEGGGRRYTIRIPAWGIMPEVGYGSGGMWGESSESGPRASSGSRYDMGMPAEAPAQPSQPGKRPSAARPPSR
jgi:hypothetical protein